MSSETDAASWPIIILVKPQLGENIGTVARAMWNCGLQDLRLVAPRDGWPNPAAIPSASGADIVLDRATVFDTVEQATADLHHVYATTARQRDMAKVVVAPRELAAEVTALEAQDHRCGVLFGGERSGLNNEDVVRSEKIVEIPSNPLFSSFNLAQAVLVVGYECLLAKIGEGASGSDPIEEKRATVDQIDGLLEHLDRELDNAEYYREPNLRPTMQRNLHNVFRRARLTDQEVRSLRGVVARLAEWRVRRPPKQS